MAKTSEERIAQRLIDTAFSRIDFEPREFAYYFTRAGYNFQFVMWKVIQNLMKFWAMELEKGSDKGNEEYLRLTIRAAQIHELMEEQERITENR